MYTSLFFAGRAKSVAGPELTVFWRAGGAFGMVDSQREAVLLAESRSEPEL